MDDLHCGGIVVVGKNWANTRVCVAPSGCGVTGGPGFGGGVVRGRDGEVVEEKTNAAVRPLAIPPLGLLLSNVRH